MPKSKLKLTRQAKSIARIRAQRRKEKLCLDCVKPAARKLIASTGKIKVLAYCEHHLDAMRAKRTRSR